MDKILVLKDGDVHPTIETVAFCVGSDRVVVKNGLVYNLNNVLTVGDTIDEGDYKITAIGTDSIEVTEMFGSDRVHHTVPLGKIEWCNECGDFHVYLDDEDDVDEYTSGYTDAIRDAVQYLVDCSASSVVRKTLKKINTNYLSDLDTDEKIAEFVSKRFEEKPQLTLDELKEIVGYDFDLV